MESEVWLACVIFATRRSIFIVLRFAMKFIRISSGSLGFCGLVLLCILFFTLESFLKHKLVELRAWSSENNTSSSYTLNFFKKVYRLK